MVRLKMVLIVASAASVTILAACSVAGQPQAAPAAAAPETVTTTETATETVTRQQPTTVTATVTASTPAFTPPPGYDSWGEGVAARWTDHAAFNCADNADSCWGVDLYSDPGCTNGILVVLDISSGTNKVGVLDGTSAAVAPAGTGSIVLNQTNFGADLTAKMADIRCVFG